MRIPRIHLPVRLRPGAQIDLDEQSAHHVRSVLRLKAGNAVKVFNGEDFEFDATLTQVGKKTVSLEVGKAVRLKTESPLKIHFGLAVSRGDRMDFAIQKSVELGVESIAPLLTERCVVKLEGERPAQKQAHWQRIAIGASEQSGRAKVPVIFPAEPLAPWLRRCRDLKIFFDPSSSRSLGSFDSRPRSVSLLSGPEGGFAAHERELAAQAGFIGVRLGPRILRSETAALAGIALIQAFWGDLGLQS